VRLKIVTVTIDSKTVHVHGNGITEETFPVGVFIDVWENEAYGKKVTIFGSYRVWTLSCYENSVAWSSCVAKYLQDKANTGDTVALIINEGNMHAVTSTNVYILSVGISYKKGSKETRFTREYTVKLQEAP
jgi:hypothetical protein